MDTKRKIKKEYTRIGKSATYTKSVKITYTWMRQTFIHITQYSEHCRKLTPVSNTHTLPPI
jgi:hypothetical protein